MSDTMHMEIVTPERVMWQGEVTELTAPGYLGELGVLPEHAPLFTNLKAGAMSFRTEGKEKLAVVHRGYLEVLDNRVTVLAERAEFAEEIDIERAQAAQGRAETRLKEFESKSEDNKDVIRARAALERALSRASIVSRLK